VFVCRLVLGVGEAVAAPASLGYIRRSFRQEESGLPTAVYTTGMMLGPAVGSLVGALLLDNMGWRAVFWLTGLGACAWLAPWLLLAPRGRHESARPAGQNYVAVPWGRVFRNRLFWGITIAAFFYSYYWYFFLTWIPSYLVMTHGFSFAKMGVGTAAPLAGTALVAVASARIADRRIARGGQPIETRRTFVTAGFLLGCLMVLLVVFRSRTAAIPVLTVSLLGLGLASANYWAVTQAISPVSMIARVVAYQNTIANAAGIVAPIVTGKLLGTDQNFDRAIISAAAALLLAAVAYRFLIRAEDAARFRADFGGG
jgi:MFS family permease